MSDGDAAENKGLEIFLDVFRRADKNDDGAICWDEFKNFFADGVLTEVELRELFNEIDTHNTNNIDTEEMCSYFTKHLGAFEQIYSGISKLNKYVATALANSSEQYAKSSFRDQMVIRFLLREIVSQLRASIQPLDDASDALEERAKCGRENETALQVDDKVAPLVVRSEEPMPPAGSITPGRIARRARRFFSSQSSWPADYSDFETQSAGGLQQQISRLSGILDRLENKISLNGVVEEQLDLKEENLMLIVQRRVHVLDQHIKAFRTGLKNYIDSIGAKDSSLYSCVRTYSGTNRFAVYEFWDSEESWKSFLTSSQYKAFQHGNIDYLETPEQIKTIQLPRAWLKADI